jgi:phosphoglycolate phosphatase
MDDLERRPFDPDAIRAVLFDLDGTLMNTDDRMVETLALRLQRFGWPGLYRHARRLVMAAETPANGLMTVLDALGLDAPLLAARRRLKRLGGPAGPAHFPLMEGADDMLANLEPRYQLAVVTTRGREDAEAFLAQHDLSEMFDLVVTRENTWRLKPHPAPICHAAERLGVPTERCVMVGDTTVDVRSAQRAGAKAVAVTCGFGERRELERAGADVILDCILGVSSVL